MSGAGRILVVDDSASQRGLLCALVASLGFQAEEAKSGREGLRKAAAAVPDLIILDVVLGDADGRDLVPQFVAMRNDAGAPPRIMLISATEVSSGAVTSGFLNGADDYVVRPYDEGELAARVHTLMRLHDEAARLHWQLARQAGLAALAREAVWPLGGLQPMLDLGARELAAAFPRAVVVICLETGLPGKIQPHAYLGEDAEHPAMLASLLVAERAYILGAPIAIDEAGSDAELAAHLETGRVYGWPLGDRGGRLGGVGLAFLQEDKLSAEGEAFVAALADSLSLIIRRQESHARVVQSERNLRRAVTLSGMGQMRCDETGRIVMANAAMAPLLATGDDPVQGRCFEDWLDDDAAQTWRELLERSRYGVVDREFLTIWGQDRAQRFVRVSLQREASGEADAGPVEVLVEDETEARIGSRLGAAELDMLRRLAQGEGLADVVGGLLNATYALQGRSFLLLAGLALEGESKPLSLYGLAPGEEAAAQLEMAYEMADSDRIPTCERARRYAWPVILTHVDLAALPPVAAGICKQHGAAAIWSFPDGAQSGDVQAVITVLSRVARPPLPVERRILSFVAEALRVAVRKHLHEQAERRAVAELHDYASLSADWFWEQDAAFRFTRVQASDAVLASRFLPVFGSPEGVIGKTRQELVTTPQPPGLWEAHQKKLDAREPFSGLLLRTVGADGELHYLESGGVPLFDAQGRFAGYRGIGRDVSERERLRETQTLYLHRLNAMLDAIPEPVLWLDGDACYRFVNVAACQVARVSRGEVLGRGPESVGLTPEQATGIREECRRVLADGRVREGRFVFGERQFYYRTAPVPGADGTPESVIQIAIDLTELLQAQTQLRSSELRYRDLFMASPQPMWIFDAKTLRIIETNPALLTHCGLKRQEVVGRSILSFRGPAEQQRFQKRYRQLGRDGAVHYGVTELRMKKGKPAWFDIHWGTLEFDGRVARLAQLVDVTALVEAEHKVREINASLEMRVAERTADLEERNRELDAFNYSVSHDLRAPLRAIAGFAEALSEEAGQQLDEAGRDYLDRINRAAGRMGALIDDMLALSRLGRGEMRVVDVDLSAMARDTAERLQRSAPQRQVEWRIDDGVITRGDPGLLGILLENLLSNAWKYTALLDQAVIRFRPLPSAESEGFVVEDNGAGFDMRYADKLFVLFQRLHRDDEFSGHGAGLAIAQRIARRHRGGIEGAGEPGNGAHFTVRLWRDGPPPSGDEGGLA